ncbi:macro domain-containing protein [Emticicia sp. C21]|uniref:macro domain-containing protein n=1 Tax=Emticicia sp. C21 TaxID=2302915 RepID=UPI000E34985F|nr:macro domain-containing protein [Emticicia sp. C21]RFS15698.1 Appr-1-p processing protein [Emticicia sp. C21]
MKEIIYLKGDATLPQANGTRIIAHICNDIGGWGKGFVVAISKRWKAPEIAYREWHKTKTDFALGNIQLIQVEDEIFVANMIAQRGMGIRKNQPPIDYKAVELCLSNLAKNAQNLQASIHMPKIGCGLGGGRWEIIEPMIQKTLLANDIETFVYDFE